MNTLNIPIYVYASYDVAQHKTQDDIAWLVRHELDLYEEGQETDLTPTTARQARRFLERYAPQLASA